MKKIIYFIILISAVWSSYVLAELDELQLQLREHYDVPVYWDNVKRAPYWISGNIPDFSRSWDFHKVTLKPGEEITVRVPKKECLKLYNPGKSFSEDDLEFFISNGSGLYASSKGKISENRIILNMFPFFRSPSLVRIVRPVHQKEPVEFTIFVSK